MRSILLAPLCAFLCSAVDVSAAPPLEGPTVRDIVEFTRIVQPANAGDNALQDQISPDGMQAFIVTCKADVPADKNRYEIHLLDLRPDHLAAQRMPAPVTVLSATASGDNNFFVPAVRDVQWHGDRTLVFLARLDGTSFQVYRLDVRTRELVQLTHETELIVSYAVSKDLQRVVYAVQVPNPPLSEGAHGVVVGNQSFWSVEFGQHDSRVQDRMYQYVAVDVASPRPARALGGVFKQANTVQPTVSISPDGRWAVLPRYEPDRLADWQRQYPMIEKISKRRARSQQVDPLAYFSKPMGYVPRRMTAWRLADGKEQMIVDAPDDALPGSAQRRPDRLWQGNGESVVLAGTHLPLTPDGNASRASHVIEYWPGSGRWIDIATLEDKLQDAHALRDGFVVIDGTRHREFQRQADGGWRESTDAAEASTNTASRFKLRMAQGLNQPPDVYASDPAGNARRLTWLNPHFNAELWGVMRPYAWRDAKGRRWEGGLMSGRGMDEHTRYPLLIQTYEFSPDRFYLDGPNVADGANGGFAGRAFLREGILVLDIPARASGDWPKSERLTLQAFDDGVRGAVNALVRQGRVDPSKVGIIGWSASGENVLNLVAFDDVPIRAATMADGNADTLFSFALTYGTDDTTWGRKEELNEGLPFGEGLASWVAHDSALHTDCIHAALRIEAYGPWVKNNWDIYSLLRRQYKPAEMIVIPDGTHSLFTPGDRMVSLQGNVDWYAFWLAGRTRTVPLLASETTESVAQQFARWRQMETLKATDDARAPCAR